MRARVRFAGLVAALAAAALVALDALPAGARMAAAGAPAGRRGISIVQVEGLIDPPLATHVLDAVADANRAGRTMLVLQIDSRGAVDVDVSALVHAVTTSHVPIVAWVGPSGAQAKGAAVDLVVASHRAYVSQGSTIGPAIPVRLDETDEPPPRVERHTLERLAGERGRDRAGARRVARHELSPRVARRLGAVDAVAPTIGEVVVTMDGRTLRTTAGEVTLSTAKVVGEGRARRRQPNQEVVFNGLGLGAQLQHGLISPGVAYVLLVAGLALMVFEFFTISIGLIGAAGALAIVGACYGFSHLPVHWWAVVLVLFATFGYSIDVQAARLGPWTGIATAALVGASVVLYGGSSALDPSWWVIALVSIGSLLFYAWGMTAAVRARFSTPTVGREGMVGALGTAEVDVDPDGVVVIDGARWRARTNRATPLKAGDVVRVVEVSGLVLEVEPETGGARDHRDRQRGRRPPR